MGDKSSQTKDLCQRFRSHRRVDHKDRHNRDNFVKHFQFGFPSRFRRIPTVGRSSGEDRGERRRKSVGAEEWAEHAVAEGRRAALEDSPAWFAG